jgi:hypothetical protein
LAAISSRNIWHASTAEAVFAGAGRSPRWLLAPGAAQALPATTTPIEHLMVDVGENVSSTTCLASMSQGPANGRFQITKHVGDDEPTGDLTSLFQF